MNSFSFYYCLITENISSLIKVMPTFKMSIVMKTITDLNHVIPDYVHSAFQAVLEPDIQ